MSDWDKNEGNFRHLILSNGLFGPLLAVSDGSGHTCPACGELEVAHQVVAQAHLPALAMKGEAQHPFPGSGLGHH